MQPSAFVRFLLGDRSTEVLDAMQADGVRWAEQTGDRPPPLHRFLGLGCPRATRKELRDARLVEAAALLPGPGRWARCKQMAEAARTFEARRWPAWARLGTPPSHASEIDRILWEARQFGEIACTPENFLTLLSE